MPCWDTPFGRALGKKWGALPLCPSAPPASPPCSQPPCQLPSGNRNIKESWRVGWGEGGGRGSQSHTEGAQGGPDSRSVTVHFLWGGGSLLGPLWPPPPYSPSFPPHPLPGSGRSERLETGWLTDAWPSTSPSKPPHALVPGSMKASAPTTKRWLGRLNRRAGSRSATANLKR